MCPDHHGAPRDRPVGPQDPSSSYDRHAGGERRSRSELMPGITAVVPTTPSPLAQVAPNSGRCRGERKERAGPAAECHRFHLDITMKIRRKDQSAPVPDGDVLVDDAGGGDLDGTGPAWEPGQAQAPEVLEETAEVVPTAPRAKGLLGEVLVARGARHRCPGRDGAPAAGEAPGSGSVRCSSTSGALDERGLVDALADFFGMPVTDLRRDTPEPIGARPRARGGRPGAPRHPRPPRRRRRCTWPWPSRATISASCWPRRAGTRSG